MGLGALGDDYFLSREVIDELRFAIMRQACLDYHFACLPPKNLPSRKKKYKTTVNGEIVSRQMTDEEYEDFCQYKEIKRLKLKEDCESFFRSAWFQLLYDDLDAELIMREIRDARKKGRKIFATTGRRDRWYT